MSLDWRSPKAKGEAITALRYLDDEVLGVNEQGEVTLGGFWEDHVGASVVARRIRFPRAILHSRREKLAHRAIIEVKKKSGKLDIEEVLQAVTVELKGYTERPLESYTLAGGLSLKLTDDAYRFKVADSVITLTKKLPPRFGLPQRASFGSNPPERIPHGWAAFRVSVKERSALDAGNLALRRLDVLRGIWNLSALHGNWRISLGRKDNPVSVVRLGAIQTLHRSNGEPVHEMYWYESSYRSESRLADAPAFDKIAAFVSQVRKRMCRSTSSSRLQNFLVRYARALDESDLNSCFLKLWALLEDITDSGWMSYDTTIKRASYVFGHRKFVRLQLDDMRHLRNEMVHEGTGAEDAERMVYQLKWIVESLFLFFVRNVGTFQSISHFGTFLSQPRDAESLKRRIAGHRIVLKWAEGS